MQKCPSSLYSTGIQTHNLWKIPPITTRPGLYRHKLRVILSGCFVRLSLLCHVRKYFQANLQQFHISIFEIFFISLLETPMIRKTHNNARFAEENVAAAGGSGSSSSSKEERTLAANLLLKKLNERHPTLVSDMGPIN